MKKQFSFKNRDVNKINGVIKDLEWTEDFGRLTSINQQIIIEKNPEYFNCIKQLIDILNNLSI